MVPGKWCPGLFIQGCSFRELEGGSEWTREGLEARILACPPISKRWVLIFLGFFCLSRLLLESEKMFLLVNPVYGGEQ
jgi:hypothetical protein